MPRSLFVVAGLSGSLLAAGCQSSGDIINKSLTGPHSAKVDSDAAAAPPPVDPAALTIAATPLGPTETPSVDPKPILPKMDAQFNERKMPAGYEQFTQPTTRAAERPELPAAPEVQQ